ncbi:MAG: hypothetical protein AABY16_04510 [Nanoarchaeota archaeon]
MSEDKSLRGEERKILSTRVYRTEFASFAKICQLENKTVNTKLREMVRTEITKKFGEILEVKDEKNAELD